MSVARVDVLCECDGCQKRFGIELDLAEELGSYAKDFEELARETIRGGQCDCYTWGVRGKATVERYPLSGRPTIQGGYMLCDVCTKKCDALPIDEDLTRVQVESALGIPNQEEAI